METSTSPTSSTTTEATTKETTTTVVDLKPVEQKLDDMINLSIFQSIIIFSILIFLAFQLALRGFYKIGR